MVDDHKNGADTTYMCNMNKSKFFFKAEISRWFLCVRTHFVHGSALLSISSGYALYIVHCTRSEEQIPLVKDGATLTTNTNLSSEAGEIKDFCLLDICVKATEACLVSTLM